MESVKRQDVTNESSEQYQTRILKLALEVLIDIRDEFHNARMDELDTRP